MCVSQNGEQCTGGGDEVNSCINTENVNSRTVAAATSYDIVPNACTEIQDTSDLCMKLAVLLILS